MDPLSITASVIAIIQVINKTLSICLSFRAALKESPTGLTRIVEETRSLRDIFEALQLSLDNNVSVQPSTSGSPVHEKVWQSISDIIPQCRKILEELDQELGSSLPAASGSITMGGRMAAAIHWRLKEQQVKSYLTQLERCKSRLTLALSAHQSTLLLDIRATTISWNAKAEASQARIEDKIDIISAWKSDEDDVLAWLSPLKFRASHLEVVAQHQPGTSNWVTACEEFDKWYRGDARLLWLNGAPGTGKTQLFAHLVEHLLADTAGPVDQPVVAYTYCDFRKPESLQPSNILGSIVAQGCTGTRFISDAIRAAFKASKSPGHEAPPPLTLLRESMEEIEQRRKLFILIDGLDESQQATEVGDILCGICSEHACLNTKVLVTGRKTDCLEQVFGNTLQIRLGDHKKEVGEDIQLYINSQLQSDRRLQWLHREVKEQILESLLRGSNSMFCWVQCQLCAISPLRSVNAIREALTKLPLGLEDTYSRILSSTAQHTEPTIRSALEWLCFSFMPLSLIELHEILAVEPGVTRIDHEGRLSSPMDILALGNPLFDLSSSGQIQLAHLSVRDYLLSPADGKNDRVGYFHLTVQHSHRTLALKCLTYLLLEDLSDGPAMTAANYVQRLQQLPFLKYAASAWPYHAKLALSRAPRHSGFETRGTDDEMLALIVDFFSTRRRGNFMAWVQVLNANYNFKWDIYPRNATALYYAASFGLDSIVETLISSPGFNGTDLDAPGSRYGGTPIHAASYRQHSSTVQILLNAGASAAKADLNGVTPLHSAAANGDLEIMRLLLGWSSAELVADAKDSLGMTPHDWAVGAAQVEAAEMLRSRNWTCATAIERPVMVTSGSGQQQKQQEPPQQPESPLQEGRRVGSDDEASVSPRLGPIFSNQPVSYFPEFYGKRSGLDSSIVIGVNIGQREA